MDNGVLVLASFRSLRCMEIEVALMHDRIPVNRIDVVDRFAFVVEQDNVVGEGFLHLGK